jgi:hypothetical protein
MRHQSQSIVDIFNIFNLLEKELLNTNQKIMGGSQTTEPYKHFEDTMNEVYDYVKDVFETNEKNKKEYRDSVKKMDKDCDCDKYKADKITNMKPSVNGTSSIFTLKEAERTESDTKIKNEWIL